MDGRRFRRWWLCGLLAAVGCHRNATYPGNIGFPKPGQSVAGLPPAAKKPFWGDPTPPSPGTITDNTGTASHTKPHKGLLPESQAAFADAQVAAAYGTPPPQNKDQLLDMARQRYHMALKTDPKCKPALLGLARMYAALGDQSQALQVYNKYLEYYPKDHATAYEIAVAHGRWKDWAGAASWCEFALRLDPENRTYRKTHGFCLARAGRWDEALQSLCRVMPEAQARYNIAGMLDHLNYPDHSRQWLQMALQVDPSYTPAREFLAELDQSNRPGSPAMPEQNPVRQAGYVQQP